MIEKILELAKKSADAAEVFLVEDETREAEFENNKLKYITTKSVCGAGLRVIVNGRIGFSSTTNLSQPEQVVEHALESAKYGQKAHFTFPAKAAPNAVAVHSPDVVDYQIQDGVKRAADAIEAVLAAAPKAQCGGNVSKGIGRKRIINSAGLDASYEYTDFYTSLSALLVRNGSLLWVGDGNSSRKLFDGFPEYTGKIIKDIRAAEREVVPETGLYSVIFTPDALGVLLLTFAQATNGKNVQKQISPLCGKLGEKLLDTEVTLTDNPQIDFAAGSLPFDDEGTPARTNVFIENGILKSYLFDLQTAGIVGMEPTGSGMRSFASQPSPGNSNFVVAAGDIPLETMIAGVKRGLIVDQLLGGGQSNTLAGEFSVNVDLGFLIENGQTAGRVKDCMLAGNAFTALNNIAAIGDKQIQKGSLFAPYICLADMNVASGS